MGAGPLAHPCAGLAHFMGACPVRENPHPMQMLSSQPTEGASPPPSPVLPQPPALQRGCKQIDRNLEESHSSDLGEWKGWLMGPD